MPVRRRRPLGAYGDDVAFVTRLYSFGILLAFLRHARCEAFVVAFPEGVLEPSG